MGAAALALASIVLALAGVSRPQTQAVRIGRGAEVLILMDRSRSMDDRMLPDDWRSVDPLTLRFQVWDHGPVKSKVARDLLSQFVARRQEDRFALMFFSSNPLNVMPLTQHQDVIQAAITAGGIGRGLADTNMGRALEAAIDQFEGRPYSGSRIILLVSDGGAKLDEDTRRRIASGLARNRIAVYFLYLRSYNGHRLDSAEPGSEEVPEVALHRFFQTLKTPYRAYQSEVPEDMTRAVADVAAQQNLPLEYLEQIPRRDYSRPLLGLAALACAMLLALHSMRLTAWR
jgi:mxaC protein